MQHNTSLNHTRTYSMYVFGIIGGSSNGEGPYHMPHLHLVLQYYITTVGGAISPIEARTRASDWHDAFIIRRLAALPSLLMAN
jgi:hypothetical protein